MGRHGVSVPLWGAGLVCVAASSAVERGVEWQSRAGSNGAGPSVEGKDRGLKEINRARQIYTFRRRRGYSVSLRSTDLWSVAA